MSATEHRVPDVIVISDDESVDEDVPSTSAMNPFLWTDVADRLLLMAKNRELRDDEQVMKTLLRDLSIVPTDRLQRSLQNTCEALGELLVLSRGNDRRHRASEDLVLVVCEVLSLMRTAKCRAMAPQDPCIKKEGVFVASNSDAIGYLYRQMHKWQMFVEELAHSSDSRAFAIDATMSHLEKLSANIKQRIESLQETQTIYQEEKERVAEQWVEKLAMCRDKAEKERKKSIEAGGLAFMILDTTFSSTSDTQAQFQASNAAYQSVEHHLHETKLHGHFCRAVRTLANTVPQVISNQNEEVCKTTAENLGGDMLAQLESFSASLQTVMLRNTQYDGYQAITTPDRSELLRLVKRLEAFWLIYRNWLPPVALETHTRRFDILLGSSKQPKCLVGNALSRVCARVRANC